MFDTSLVGEMAPGPALAVLLAGVDIKDLDADQALAFLVASDRQAAWQDARRVEAIGHFADLNATIPQPGRPGGERLATTGGDGAPDIAEFAVDEFAAAIGVTAGAAHRQVAVTMDLRHRLPHTYEALRTGRIAYWRAKLVAEQTRRLGRDGVGRVDAELADQLPGLGWRRLRDVVEAAAMNADPVGAEKEAESVKPERRIDVYPDSEHGLKTMLVCADTADVIRFDAAVDFVADLLGRLGDADPKPERRSKAIGVLAYPYHALVLVQAVKDGDTKAPGWADAMVYVHLTKQQWEAARDGAATVEEAGPITTGQARELLGHSNVTVQPVIDLNDMPTSDGRFARGRLREAVMLKTPHCPFPTCCTDAKKGQVDHTIPAPRGPTRIDNLSPPCTRHHRVKTHAGWRMAQPVNGIYLWESPPGRSYLIDRTGTAQPVDWHTQ